MKLVLYLKINKEQEGMVFEKNKEQDGMVL